MLFNIRCVYRCCEDSDYLRKSKKYYYGHVLTSTLIWSKHSPCCGLYTTVYRILFLKNVFYAPKVHIKIKICHAVFRFCHDRQPVFIILSQQYEIGSGFSDKRYVFTWRMEFILQWTVFSKHGSSGYWTSDWNVRKHNCYHSIPKRLKEQGTWTLFHTNIGNYRFDLCFVKCHI